MATSEHSSVIGGEGTLASPHFYPALSESSGDVRLSSRLFSYETAGGLVTGIDFSVAFTIDRSAAEVWKYFKDFNAWQTSYNGNEKNRTSAGITKSKVFRSTDDPNDVLLLQDVADASKARTWYGSSEMKSLMEKSGVVGSPSIRSAA